MSGAVLAVEACGSEASETSEPATTEATSTTGTVDSAESVDSGPVAVSWVRDDVEFYPACGNERLLLDGEEWYQVDSGGEVEPGSDLADRIEEGLAAERQQWGDPQGLVRVASPGPGDDVGTMVVWEDGFARWTSDSGDLEAWLIDEEIEFLYVC